MNDNLNYGECPRCHRTIAEGHVCPVLCVDKAVIKGIADAFMSRIRRLETEIKRLNERKAKD